MRYADGPSTEAEILIRADIGRVWALVSDVSLPARFSEELQSAAWADGDEPGLGARIIGTNRHPVVGEWTTTSFVDAYDEPTTFGWSVADLDAPAASWRFHLDEDDGHVRLRQWCRLGPGPSGLTPALEAMPDKEPQILERRLAEHRANMARTLEGIRDLAEAED